MSTPDVFVVVLSYNRPHYLREALDSVVAQTCHPAEVLVVDNRSPASDLVAQVVAEIPEARLIANPGNLGFAAGMNVGLREATGEYVLLTEDDIVLAPGALEAVVRHLEDHPRVGMAGALMLNKSSGTVRCAGGEVRLGSRYSFRLTGEGRDDLGMTAPYRVNYLPGAFILARRELLIQVGGFWEELFMYQEDVDLCLRVVAMGVGIDVVPAAVVRHFDPSDRPDPPWLANLKMRNLLWIYVRHAPPRTFAAFFVRYYLLGMARALATDRRRAWAIARAVIVTGFHLPRLLSLRWRSPPAASDVPPSLGEGPTPHNQKFGTTNN